eukprot:6205611-Pleurochrysis_carterae.AAC.3
MNAGARLKCATKFTRAGLHLTHGVTLLEQGGKRYQKERASKITLKTLSDTLPSMPADMLTQLRPGHALLAPLRGHHLHRSMTLRALLAQQSATDSKAACPIPGSLSCCDRPPVAPSGCIPDGGDGNGGWGEGGGGLDCFVGGDRCGGGGGRGDGGGFLTMLAADVDDASNGAAVARKCSQKEQPAHLHIRQWSAA